MVLYSFTNNDNVSYYNVLHNIVSYNAIYLETTLNYIIRYNIVNNKSYNKKSCFTIICYIKQYHIKIFRIIWCIITQFHIHDTISYTVLNNTIFLWYNEMLYFIQHIIRSKALNILQHLKPIALIQHPRLQSLSES